MNRQEMAMQHQGRSRTWLIALPTIGLVLLAAAWSGFWYYSAGKAQASLDEWRSREASAGRIYRCGEESFGGYPFRIEMHCRDPLVEDHGTALTLRAEDLMAVAQVWDPTLLIGEISGPMTMGPTGGDPAMTMKWTLAQASLRGLPVSSQRLSIVVDKPGLTASNASALASADHLEFHVRRAAKFHRRKSGARFLAGLHPFHVAVDGQLCRGLDRCPHRRRVARDRGFHAEADRRQAARAPGRQRPAGVDRREVPAGRPGHHRGRTAHADAARHPQWRSSAQRHQFRQAAAGDGSRPHAGAGGAAGDPRQAGAGPRPADAGSRQYAARQYRRRRRGRRRHRCRRCRWPADRARGAAGDQDAAASRRRRRLSRAGQDRSIPPLY